MSLEEVMKELESLGSEQTRKIFARHNGPQNMFGVKVADLKKVLKKIKKDQELALALYNTGNADAQYLAGLAADAQQMTKEQLIHWAKTASWQMVAEYAVAWNVGESPHCIELCKEWVHSDDDQLKQIGWASLGAHLLYAKRPDIDEELFSKMLDHVSENIHGESDRVKYTMNGFVIALGGAEPELYQRCLEKAKSIGKVEVFMGETACKVPFAPDYLEKMNAMGKIGNRKRTVKC